VPSTVADVTPKTGQPPGGEVAGRVAIVTGASQGIGAGIVTALLALGYAVVGTSRSIEPSEIDNMITVPGDIAELETAKRVLDAAVDTYGRVDCLINDAGMSIEKPFTDYDVGDFTRITEVNVGGFFHMTQTVVRQMLRQGAGHIVSITTSLVDHPTTERLAALTALTKGGIDAATRSLAIELAAHGIRVNAVAPGVIYNPRYDRASYTGLAEQHPLDRLGEVSDVVDGILYLERAGFVTGEVLHIDGGQAAGG
jgi:NAD(P)-dependent dehydrogenase (short-subunit alcohol dehydrogenase family)